MLRADFLVAASELRFQCRPAGDSGLGALVLRQAFGTSLDQGLDAVLLFLGQAIGQRFRLACLPGVNRLAFVPVGPECIVAFALVGDDPVAQFGANFVRMNRHQPAGQLTQREASHRSTLIVTRELNGDFHHAGRKAAGSQLHVLALPIQAHAFYNRLHGDEGLAFMIYQQQFGLAERNDLGCLSLDIAICRFCGTIHLVNSFQSFHISRSPGLHAGASSFQATAGLFWLSRHLNPSSTNNEISEFRLRRFLCASSSTLPLTSSPSRNGNGLIRRASLM
ncbi:hypothetical protein D3C84_657020 [compost metagenome]